MGNSGLTERVLGHFALIAIAGELATKFGITGWQPRDALTAVFELANEWHETQDRSEKWQIAAAITRTRSYLQAHSSTRFEEAGGVPVTNRSGYRDEKWFYIIGDTWNAIHAGFSPTDQARHLLAGRWMVRGDGKNHKCKTPSWVLGRPRAYKGRADILESSAFGAPSPTPL